MILRIKRKVPWFTSLLHQAKVSPHLSVDIPDVCIVECSDGSSRDCTQRLVSRNLWTISLFSLSDVMSMREWSLMITLTARNGLTYPRIEPGSRLPGRLKITIISLWLFYHLLQPQPVMLINNRYKDKLLRLKGEEQINNEHWASVLSGGLERDQVQIMIKVTVIDSKQVTTERRAALPYVSSSPS